MGKIEVILRAVNMLVENADPGSLDEGLLQQHVISDGKRAGREFRRFLEQGAQSSILVPDKHVVDCRRASMPKEWQGKGWKAEQKNLGLQIFDSSGIRLFTHPKQQGTGTIVGTNLRKELSSKMVLPDAFLDFYLAHPELIPEEWKGKAVFFWGTVYTDPDGYCCVRCLFWYGERWNWDYSWLGSLWSATHPAAVLASSAEDLDTQR